MSKENTIHDAFGRLVYRLEPYTNTIFHYSYFGDKRTVKILNDNNTTNFRTIKVQNILNGDWTDSWSEEYGETLYVHRKFEKGKEIYLKQINLKSNSIYIKYTLYKTNSDSIKIWIEQYRGQKNIGFTVQKKLLQQWQQQEE
jgi:hypothetical protein